MRQHDPYNVAGVCLLSLLPILPGDHLYDPPPLADRACRDRSRARARVCVLGRRRQCAGGRRLLRRQPRLSHVLGAAHHAHRPEHGGADPAIDHAAERRDGFRPVGRPPGIFRRRPVRRAGGGLPRRRAVRFAVRSWLLRRHGGLCLDHRPRAAGRAHRHRRAPDYGLVAAPQCAGLCRRGRCERRRARLQRARLGRRQCAGGRAAHNCQERL